VRLFKAAVFNLAFTELSPALSLKPGKDGDRFMCMKPAKPDLYQVEPLGVDDSVKPLVVGGTWYPRRPTMGDDVQLVVLHFHGMCIMLWHLHVRGSILTTSRTGGAFIANTGRTHEGGSVASMVLEQTKASHVFMPQYRLSSHVDCQFPAALQDAITSYCYLTQELGVPGSKIILSGDSAGGNLVLALLRYFADYGERFKLQVPSAAWLWYVLRSKSWTVFNKVSRSPWVDPTNSYRSTSYYNSFPTVPTDYLTSRFGTWGARQYAPNPSKTSLTIRHPYISFVGAAFQTPVPMFIQSGSCEVLSLDIFKLYEEMRDIKGNRAELHILDGHPHDTFYHGKQLGFQDDVAKVTRRAWQWTEEVTRAHST